MNSDVINDKKGSRFVKYVDGSEVYVLYVEERDTLDLYSTFTPRELRGKGLASEVVKAAFDYAISTNKKVIPSCPYIPTFLEKNPSYKKYIIQTE